MMSQIKITSVCSHRPIAKVVGWGLTFSLGLLGSLLTLSGRANAIETVKLVYENNDAVVSLDEIRSFAETGQAPPQIQQFLLDNGQPAEIIARLLTEQITLSENLRQRLRQDLDSSSIGQFVLYQIDKIIRGSSDLTDLKAALDASVEDRTFSIIELLENYTGAEQVTVNLVGLRQTYEEVKTVVERVIPVLETAKEYLQDIICECETPAPSDSSSSPQSWNQNSGTPAVELASSCTVRTTTTETSPALTDAHLSAISVHH